MEKENLDGKGLNPAVSLGDDLREIKEELDEHLDALNQNTAEIGSVHEYLSELDVRLMKLGERVDALQTLLLSQTPNTKSVRLTPKEEELLRALLDTKEPMNSLMLGKLTGLTSDLAAQTLFCLKQKGIPIHAQLVDEQTFYVVESAFKELQRAKFSVSNN